MRAVPLCLRSPLLHALLFACVVTSSSRVAAQMLEQPLTTLLGALGTSQLAAGRDGAILQAADPVVVVRLFPFGDSTPASTVTIGGDALNGIPGRVAVTALPRGGFAAAWPDVAVLPVVGQRSVTLTQRLSPAGVPTGPAVPATGFRIAIDFPGIAPLGDGFVVVVRAEGDLVAQRFDATGTAIGGNVFITQTGDANTRAVGLPGDRVLVVWGRDDDTSGQLFAPDLTPLSAVFTVATSFEPTGLAVNAAGTLAAVVGTAHNEDPTPGEARLRFFAPDGSLVGSDIDLDALTRPDVATDPSGNFLVMTHLTARAYDAGGVALGPPVSLGPTPGLNERATVRVTGRREGGFFAILAGAERARVARITLCTPGAAVCGDGTLVPTCEICDTGAGNSDTTPDACRTDCRPARCGDGVTDTDEQCDDGNHRNCDGCSELCEIEAGTMCGDALVAPLGCKEECDEGDADAGDGCSPTCKVERILGGGKYATDCYAAWRIDNPSNEPRFAKLGGGVNPKQRCRDNDSACDFDGGLPGSCTFHLAVCVNNSEPVGCRPGRLESWTILKPSEKHALTRPPLAAVRAALSSVVVPGVVGAGDPNVCSSDVDVVVPLRGVPGTYKANKLTLKTRAALYSGDVDDDKLQLRCDP